MVVTKNCFLGNVFTGFTLVEKFSPKNVVVVVVLPLPNKRTNGVEPLIQEIMERDTAGSRGAEVARESPIPSLVFKK